MSAFFPPDYFSYGYRLPLGGPAQTGPPLAADEELALAVAARLRQHLTGTGNRVMVEVQNRVVILDGSVNSDELRSHFHHLVWHTPGVADVCNRLTVLHEDDDRTQH